MSRYMNNPDATREAFDKDGFYKTGDIARREGTHYFIEGRSSVDSRLPLFDWILQGESLLKFQV